MVLNNSKCSHVYLLYPFWFTRGVKLDYWCFIDWFVHGTFEKSNIFFSGCAKSSYRFWYRCPINLIMPFNFLLYETCNMILKHLLHMSNLHNVHIKFVSKIRMYLIPGKYKLSAPGYKSSLLVHKTAFPGAYLSKL